MQIREKTKEKLTAMARCLAEGKSVRQCLKEVGLSSDTYARYKSLVWDMVKTMKKAEGKEEKKEGKEEGESLLEKYAKEVAPPPPPGELGKAVEALRATMQFFDAVEQMKQEMMMRLAAPPPGYAPVIPAGEGEGERKEEGELVVSASASPLEVLKTAHELLEQSKKYLESFGYLVIPPSERHKWYHEEEVKALLKKKAKEEGQGGWSKEQFAAMERIVTTIVDRIAGAFEKAVLSAGTGSPEEQQRQKLLKEVQQALLEEGEGGEE